MVPCSSSELAGGMSFLELRQAQFSFRSFAEIVGKPKPPNPDLIGLADILAR